MENLKKYIQQPNKITLSKQRFSLIEKRIVYLCINQLEAGINVNEDLFKNKVFTIPVEDIGEVNYGRIKEEAEKLQSRQIKFLDDDVKQEFDSITPFYRVRYKAGILTVNMAADVVPHFLELKKGFTQYQLKAAIALSSTYSQRLYELLSRFKDTGHWHKVEVVYLKTLLNIQDKYAEITMFRARVLDPAEKELKEKTELSFTYELHKTGRKYTHITFTIQHHQATRPLSEKQLRCKQYLESFGLQRKVLQNQILYNKQPEFWKWLHFYQLNKEKITNPAGHLLKALNLS